MNVCNESAWWSFVLDSNDVPHCTYATGTGTWDPVVHYAHLDGSGCLAETVSAATGEWGGYPVVTVDGQNRPTIVYFDWSNSQAIIVARRLDDSWSHDVLDRNLGTLGSMGTAVAYDILDSVHVVYFDHSKQSLMYARRDSSHWDTEAITGNIGTWGALSSIAIDGDCNPHITCFDYDREALLYITHDGSRWITDDIADDLGVLPGRSSIAVAPDGSVGISYFDFEEKTLHYVELGHSD